MLPDVQELQMKESVLSVSLEWQVEEGKEHVQLCYVDQTEKRLWYSTNHIVHASITRWQLGKRVNSWNMGKERGYSIKKFREEDVQTSEPPKVANL